MPAGRPTLLDAGVQERILECLRGGNYRRVAAEWAGVSFRAFCEWMQRGKDEPDSIYGELRTKVIEAERGAEIGALKLIMDAAAKSPTHAEWYLSRKNPKRWARPELGRDPVKVELVVQDQLQGVLQKLERSLDGETYRQVLGAITSADGGSAPAAIAKTADRAIAKLDRYGKPEIHTAQASAAADGSDRTQQD